MKKYIADVTMTGRNYGRSEDGYSGFSQERYTFDSHEELQEHLNATYGKCKRRRIFRDNPDGSARPVGWIYCFNNADWSHAPVKHWRQQDWVTIYEADIHEMDS